MLPDPSIFVRFPPPGTREELEYHIPVYVPAPATHLCPHDRQPCRHPRCAVCPAPEATAAYDRYRRRLAEWLGEAL